MKMNKRYEDIYISDIENIIESFGDLTGLKLIDFLENINSNDTSDMQVKNHWSESKLL